MSSSNVENVAPNVLRKIYKELGELISSPPEGIKVLANEEDVSDIHAIIDGPAGTPYQNGSFRVKLVLGKSFPATPPKGYFLTKIFHPNVSRMGEICVNTLKKDWNENLGIKHILLVIKCLLIVPNPESALNEDAAKLLLEDYDEYYRRAKMITEIHAKRIVTTDKDSKIAINESSDYYTTNSSSSSSSASSDSNNALTNKNKSTSSNNSSSSQHNEFLPLTKRQANSLNMTNNIHQKPTTAKPDAKKRTLKRL